MSSQFWSSKGNHVMSILHVDLNIPGGTYSIDPSEEATMLVWNVPSNLSSALKQLVLIIFNWTFFQRKFCIEFLVLSCFRSTSIQTRVKKWICQTLSWTFTTTIFTRQGPFFTKTFIVWSLFHKCVKYNFSSFSFLYWTWQSINSRISSNFQDGQKELPISMQCNMR